MPPRSVSAVFGTSNGERIVGSTAIRCLGATQEPFRFTAMPRLKFFQGHSLPFPCQNGWGVRRNGGYVNVACGGASHTTAVQFSNKFADFLY